MIAVADSKMLFRHRNGLGRLERGILTALHASCGPVTDSTQLWHVLRADRDNQRQRLPWSGDFRRPLPAACSAAEITRLADNLQHACRRCDVYLESVQARAIFPAAFNAQIGQLGNKSTLLSRASLALLDEVLPAQLDRRAIAVCDKHGGRNRYRPLLAQQFPRAPIGVCREGRGESVYRWGPPEAAVEVRFTTGGEAFLPTALASMTAKYLRELAMQAENAFWCQRISGLRPTAGYPVDARRFKRDIEDFQQQLAIPDQIIWRVK
jgi:hypothetical protein